MLRFPAFGLLVLLAIAGGALYLYAESQQENAREKQALTPERLALLQFSDQRLSLDSYFSKISGIVTNTSPSLTIRGFDLKVLVYDCPDLSKPGCVAVGENETSVYLVIPPKQKRSYEGSVTFSGLPRLPPTGWSWAYTLRAVRAD